MLFIKALNSNIFSVFISTLCQKDMLYIKMLFLSLPLYRKRNKSLCGGLAREKIVLSPRADCATYFDTENCIRDICSG